MCIRDRFIGIYLFKEPFEPIQLVAFAIIWVGLVFFSYGEYKESRESRLNEKKQKENLQDEAS